MKKISRRNFMKGSAATAALVMISPTSLTASAASAYTAMIAQGNTLDAKDCSEFFYY